MASIHRRKGDRYYARFKDACGRWVEKTTGTTDKGTALRIARGWEDEAAAQRAGVPVAQANEPEANGMGEGKKRDGLYRRERSQYWWVHFQDTNGKTQCKSTKETDYDKAKAIRDEWVRDATEEKRQRERAARKESRKLQGIKSIQHNGETYVRLADLAEFIRMGRLLDDTISGVLSDPVDQECEHDGRPATSIPAAAECVALSDCG